MKLLAEIRETGNWGDHPKSYALSSDGRLVAVRSSSAQITPDHDTVFIYRTDGTPVLSFPNASSNEYGIAFWPDDAHVIVSGCGQEGDWNADGIKCWSIRHKKYNLCLADTPLTNTNVNICGVSPTRRYVVGYNGYSSDNKIWCVDTNTKQAVSINCKQPGAGSSYRINATFSDDEKYVAIMFGSRIAGDRRVTVHETASGQMKLSSFRANDYSSYQQVGLCFLSHSHLFCIATRTFEGTFVEIWNISSNIREDRHRMDPFVENIVGIDAGACKPDGTRLALGCTSYPKPAASTVLVVSVPSFAVLDNYPVSWVGYESGSFTEMGYGQGGEIVAVHELRWPDGNYRFKGQILLLK